MSSASLQATCQCIPPPIKSSTCGVMAVCVGLFPFQSKRHPELDLTLIRAALLI